VAILERLAFLSIIAFSKFNQKYASFFLKTVLYSRYKTPMQIIWIKNNWLYFTKI